MLLVFTMVFTLISSTALAGETATGTTQVEWAGAANCNPENNSVVTTAFPKHWKETELKWATHVGHLNYGAYYAGNTAVAGDYIYITGNKYIYKINKQSGDIEKQSAITDWTTTNQTDGVTIFNNRIYISNANSIRSFDLNLDDEQLVASGLNLGQYHSMLQGIDIGGDKDYLYCNGVIIDLANGCVKQIRVSADSEQLLNTSNFAWSSGATAGNYFYVSDKTKIYAIDVKNGYVADTFNGYVSKTGNTSGQIVYDNETGRLYLGAKGEKKLISLKLNTDGTFAADSLITCESTLNTVTSPVISGNKIYVAGQSGNAVDVFEYCEGVDGTESITLKYSVKNAETEAATKVVATVQSNPILSTYGGQNVLYFSAYDGDLYAMTDNGESGKLIRIADTPNWTNVQYPNAYEQISVDTQGNIYCYNESGYLFCYGKSECEVPTITKDLPTDLQKNQLYVGQLMLEIEANATKGNLSYQWQESADASVWADIDSATENTFQVPNKEAKTVYYRCIVTNTADGKKAKRISANAKVETRVFGRDATIATDGLYVNKSNSSTGTKSNSKAYETRPELIVIDESFSDSSFPRLWVKPSDINAEVTVKAVYGIKTTKNGEEAAGGTILTSTLSNGLYRTSIYLSGEYGIIEVLVQSEDKTSLTRRYVVISKTDITDEMLSQIREKIGNIKISSIDVNVTLANKGKIQEGKDGTLIGDVVLKVIDRDQDGIFTVDEALKALHDTYYDGGADAGYESAVGVFGLSIRKLWGDTSGAFGYYLNDNQCWSLSDSVNAGDYLTAFIYTDQTGWSDAYSAFDKNLYTGAVGTEVILTLSQAGYDSNYNTVITPCSGAKVKVIGINNRTVPYSTDENGQVKLKFESAGTYKVMAYKDDGSIVPSVATITVTGTSDSATAITPTDPATSADPSKQAESSTGTGAANPQTGDNSNLVLWIMLLSVSAVGITGTAVYIRRKRAR